MGNPFKLTEKQCDLAAPGISPEEQATLGHEIPEWINVEAKRIQRTYKFKTYMDGVSWVQQAGLIADAEDHHPDIHLLYRKVTVELWTHSVNGLSENDYILAAKLDDCFNDYYSTR